MKSLTSGTLCFLSLASTVSGESVYGPQLVSCQMERYSGGCSCVHRSTHAKISPPQFALRDMSTQYAALSARQDICPRRSLALFAALSVFVLLLS